MRTLNLRRKTLSINAVWRSVNTCLITAVVHPPSSRLYSPGWALASSITSLHCSLFFVFSIHFFIFITFKSATTSSIHLKWGLPFLLPMNSLRSIIFLGIAPTSILSTCPNHLILWAFMNLTISFPFTNLFISSLSLILHISPSCIGPKIFRSIFLSKILNKFS